MTQKTPSRGRPRNFDRDAALEAAMIVFWKKGYSAASMTDLCAAMGIASPSLYAAFGSKENLFSEALAHYSSIGMPKIWGPLEDATTAREGVIAFLQNSAENLAEASHPRGCMATLSDAAYAELPGLCNLLRSERSKPLAMLQARLRRGITEGDLPADFPVESTARFYLTVQQGMSIQARDGASRRDLKEIAASAMTAWPV